MHFRHARLLRLAVTAMGLGVLVGAPVAAMDVSVRDFTSALFSASKTNPVNYANRNFSSLDLSGIDFKSARLMGSNMFGVDLTDADLSNADLAGALLDRTTILRTNFSGANLSGARMLRPAAFVTEERSRSEAPRFANADLTSLRLTGIFWGADFRGANLSGADFSAFPRFTHTLKTSLRSCDFSGSTLDVVCPSSRHQLLS